MDALTRERYTSPWWTTHPDNSDGPTALLMDAVSPRPVLELVKAKAS